MYKKLTEYDLQLIRGNFSPTEFQLFYFNSEICIWWKTLKFQTDDTFHYRIDAAREFHFYITSKQHDAMTDGVSENSQLSFEVQHMSLLLLAITHQCLLVDMKMAWSKPTPKHWFSISSSQGKTLWYVDHLLLHDKSQTLKSYFFWELEFLQIKCPGTFSSFLCLKNFLNLYWWPQQICVYIWVWPGMNLNLIIHVTDKVCIFVTKCLGSQFPCLYSDRYCSQLLGPPELFLVFDSS